MHPLVADLLATDDKASQTNLLGRTELSKRWVAEAAKIEDAKPRRGPDGDDGGDELEEEYDVSPALRTGWTRRGLATVADVLSA